MSSEARVKAWRFLFALAFVAFVLNWIWEMAQMSAYTEMVGAPWMSTSIPCAWASVGDVGFTFFVYGIGALAARRIEWGMACRWHVVAAAAILSAVLAAAYEWKAQASGRWSYTDDMPIVPVLGVGLWPFLQLMLTVPASLGIAQWYSERRANKNRST